MQQQPDEMRMTVVDATKFGAVGDGKQTPQMRSTNVWHGQSRWDTTRCGYRTART
ncbi:hypothetical protein PO124_34405 [Bacillus licheniformis]|nr:hypothetical protein [Bacillus licheniformis]